MKVAIVTGASSGIGQGAAIRIAERGAGVILTFHSDLDGARDTVSAIKKLGGSAVALPLDLDGARCFPAFVDQVAAELAGGGTGRRSTTW